MEMTTVCPKEITDVLLNPGMGWSSHSCFYGDPAYLNRPPSSVAYFRLFWDDLEPEEGQYRWDIIDNLIATARSRGQDIALRLRSMNGSNPVPRPDGTTRNYRVPDWFRNSGCKGKDFTGYPGEPPSPPVWEPDYGDPLYIEKHCRFISDFARRYDGHRHLDHVDIGPVGRFGEWHCAAVADPLFSPYPPMPACRLLIDAYVNGFRRTPLLMLPFHREAMTYAISRGTGWRADALGDCRQGVANPYWEGGTSDFNHMDDVYFQRVVQTGAAKAWKRAPVAFETCWGIDRWYKEGWNVDYIFAYALAFHTTLINITHGAVPEEWWPQMNDVSRKLGYRFVLRKLEHPRAPDAAGKLPLRMEWENRGVAPMYRRFALAFRVQDAQGRTLHTALAQANLNSWLPGRVKVEETLCLPRALPAGDLRISVAVVEPSTFEPVVRLAIEGREADGWYPVSRVRMG